MSAQPSYRQAPPNLVGGVRAVDFVNTVEWRGDPEARGERLTGYDEFLVWAEAAWLIDATAHKRLAADAGRRPAMARKVLREAVTLREALAAVLSRGDKAALTTLNAALSATRFSYRLEPAARGGPRAVAPGGEAGFPPCPCPSPMALVVPCPVPCSAPCLAPCLRPSGAPCRVGLPAWLRHRPAWSPGGSCRGVDPAGR